MSCDIPEEEKEEAEEAEKGETKGKSRLMLLPFMVKAETKTETEQAAVVPDPPTDVVATFHNGNMDAMVYFEPPKFDGGVFIDMFTVYDILDGKLVTGKRSPILIPGITNGCSFKIMAHNSCGEGPYSEPSNVLEMQVVPFAPQITHCVAGNSCADLTFEAPSMIPNSPPVDIYSVVGSSDDSALTVTTYGHSSPILIRGLTNGCTYTFKIRAQNIVG